jgi:hypothetical protein
MFKLSRFTLACLGVGLGCLLFITGIGLAFGVPYLLLVAGIAVVGASLLFIDVDSKKESRK